MPWRCWRASTGAPRRLQEVREIEETVAAETGTLAELFQPGLRRALWIAVSLAILQQITGINTVLFYGSLIFQEHVGGGSATSAIFANVLVGAVNFAATIVALAVIDKLGRRPLLMISSGVMAAGPTGAGAGVPRGASAGRPGARHHAGLRGLLRGGSGSGSLGGAFGDLPDAHSRAGHVHRHHQPVVRVHAAHHDVSLAEPGALGDRGIRHLLGDVRGHVPARVARRPRDQGPQPGGNRAVVARCRRPRTTLVVGALHALFDDPAVEQADGPVGELGVARIVRHHADGRTGLRATRAAGS